MYRLASRYESRSIREKCSRSARSTWVESHENCPYAAGWEVENRRFSRDPYLTEDSDILCRYFQHSKGASGSADLMEAQRLAASFFSQHPVVFPAPPPVYRDAARSSRPLSSELSMDRYLARGQYRDRDVGVDRRPYRSNADAVCPPSMWQLVLEDWEEERLAVDGRRVRMDLYGVSAAGGRMREEVGLDDNDYDSGGRKEIEYPPIQTAADLKGGLRVTMRVDWTGLLRSDESTKGDGMALNTSLSKRATGQNYRGGGRPRADSYFKDLETELDREGSLYSRRGRGYNGSARYRDTEGRKEREHFDERLPDREDYVLGRSLGSRVGGRGVRGTDYSRADRDTSAGRVQRLSDTERWRVKDRCEGDSRRFFYSNIRYSGGGSRSGADTGLVENNPPYCKGRGGRYCAAKRHFSQRASITNQDILAVYYGNQGPAKRSSKFTQRRNFPHSLPSWYTGNPAPPSLERNPPRWPSGSPFSGRPGRHHPDFIPLRKGKKRWEKPSVEGSDGKRFKMETQSDKLYLMHNKKATTEEEEDEAAASLSLAQTEVKKTIAKEEKSIRETSEHAAEDVPKTTDASVVEGDPTEPTNGSWDNDDSWSEGEDEGKQTQLTWDAPSTVEGSRWGQLVGEKREEAASQALQSGAVNDSKKFFGVCAEDDEDDDGDWESFASDLDDQLDDVCVYQGSETADAVTESPDGKGVVPTNSEAQAWEDSGRVGAVSVTHSQDSEMVDVDHIDRSEEGKEAPDVDSSVKEGRVGGEKKVLVTMEELQESRKNREDKAFDYYVSLFEQDTDLMKLFESNVNCGSFECLVCAGVGAKKKKRFSDVASLVQHAKKVLRTKKLPEHRGFGRAVCNILGWGTVPGLSVILPRGCIAPQQSVRNTLPINASERKRGVNGVTVDWEWAAARQLFEGQEAPIDVPTRSSVNLLEIESVTTSGRFASSQGKNPDTPQGTADLVTVVEMFSRGERARGVDVTSVIDISTVQAFSVPEEAASVAVISEPEEVDGVATVSAVGTATGEAISVPEIVVVVKASSGPEIVTVVDANSVPEKIAVGESRTVTEKAKVAGASLVHESTALDPEGTESTPSSSERLTEEAEGLAVEMWAPLPQDGIVGEDPSEIIGVNTIIGSAEVGPLVVGNECDESASDVSGSLSREATSKVAGVTTLVSLEVALGNGIEDPVGESCVEWRVEDCDAVLLCATVGERGSPLLLQERNFST